MRKNFWAREIEISGFSAKLKASAAVSVELSDILEALVESLSLEEATEFCAELRKSLRRIDLHD